jgi:hypothetical protein
MKSNEPHKINALGDIIQAVTINKDLLNKVTESISKLPILGDILTGSAAVIQEVADMIQLEYDLTVGVLDGNYDYYNEELHPWDYPDIDYSPAIYYDKKNKQKVEIEWYMFNKIRSIFSYQKKSHGYPIEAFKKISFDGGVSMWIPITCDIDFYHTAEMWIDDPQTAWRYCYIIYTGSNMTKALLNLIPFFDMDNALQLFSQATRKKVKIFKRIAFYNTIHDNLIVANWDYVKEILESF